MMRSSALTTLDDPRRAAAVEAQNQADEELLQELMQVSSPGFPVTTLGL